MVSQVRTEEDSNVKIPIERQKRPVYNETYRKKMDVEESYCNH